MYTIIKKNMQMTFIVINFGSHFFFGVGVGGGGQYFIAFCAAYASILALLMPFLKM
jgi:hypothetical protein